jgi:DNA-binding transcriptional MerR regulator
MKNSSSKTPLVKISELARLSGVPAPTIKHYMREGLLPRPARRTSRNMAYYDVRLAERVRAIKDLQQSHFLPLKLIGDLLAPPPSAELRDDLDDETRQRLGLFGPAVREGHLESRRHAGGHELEPRSRKDILAKLYLSAAELDQLAELGLAESRPAADGKPSYADADLELIEVIHETRAKQLEDLFPMEILEAYVEKVRSLVLMELELFRQRVLDGETTLPEIPMADIVRDATHLSERMIVAMRTKIVFAEIRKLTESGAAAEIASQSAARGKGKATPAKPGKARAALSKLRGRKKK